MVDEFDSFEALDPKGMRRQPTTEEWAAEMLTTRVERRSWAGDV